MNTPGSSLSIAAEAARYAVLQHIGGALRHQMAGRLQPIHMASEGTRLGLAGGRLQGTDAADRVAQIGRLSKEAMNELASVFGWLSAKAQPAQALTRVVQDSVELLETPIALRGFSADTVNVESAQEVEPASARLLVCAALLLALDAFTAPGRISLVATGDTLTLTRVPQEGMDPFESEPVYRAIEWADVEALAAQAGATASREGERLVLAFRPLPAA